MYKYTIQSVEDISLIPQLTSFCSQRHFNIVQRAPRAAARYFECSYHHVSRSNTILVTMKTSTMISSLVGAFLATPVLATINYGKAHYNDGHVDNAIWIDGQDACTYVYLGPDGQNPCTYNSGWFQAQNGYTYRLVGCGGSGFGLLNSDGSINSFAHSNPYSKAGNGCSSSNGGYYVDQQWSFY